MHPETGELWQSENGPNGGDEINIIKPGKNYGWPLVSYGRSYPGPWQAKLPTHEGYEPPVVYWMPAIAVSGMAFYTGDKLPKWKGDVFVGSLRTGEIPGTGHVERMLFNEKMEELRRESLLVDLRQRVRDVSRARTATSTSSPTRTKARCCASSRNKPGPRRAHDDAAHSRVEAAAIA